MTNRYMAGDWRQFYLDIEDNTINSASLNFHGKMKILIFQHLF